MDRKKVIKYSLIDKSISDMTTVKSSSYIPGSEETYVELLRYLPSDSFIIGIGYDDAIGGDFQQAVTGTVNSKVDAIDNNTKCNHNKYDMDLNCAKRETYEEVFLDVGEGAIKFVCHDVSYGKKHGKKPIWHWNHYQTAISDCNLSTDNNKYLKTCKKHDRTFQKVSNTIYGTEHEVMELFEKMQESACTNQDTSDKIAYFTATPVEIAIQLIQKRDKENIYNPVVHDVSTFI